MRTTLTAILTIACLCTSIGQEKAHQYAIKSGHIEYELLGNTTGTKSLWWDNYGEKTYTEINSVSVTKFMGMTTREEEHKINIIDKDKYWSIDLKDNTGQKGTLPYYDMSHEIAGDMSEAEAKALEEEIMNAFGGQRLGTENVLGYPCEVIEIMGAKSWIYKGILLKSEARILGISANETAKSFDKNCHVPATKFVAQNGINYTDIDAAQAAYFGSMNEAFEEDGENYTEAEESDAEIIPLSYSYSDFLNGINPVTKKGYTRTMATNADGQYIAVFMNGLFSGITIVATSHNNLQAENNDNFASLEQFSHNGHNCYYGEEDGDTILAVEFKSEDMIVLFAPTSNQSKEALLKIADSCTF